jgi:hypothetical protein
VHDREDTIGVDILAPLISILWTMKPARPSACAVSSPIICGSPIAISPATTPPATNRPNAQLPILRSRSPGTGRAAKARLTCWPIEGERRRAGALTRVAGRRAPLGLATTLGDRLIQAPRR